MDENYNPNGINNFGTDGAVPPQPQFEQPQAPVPPQPQFEQPQAPVPPQPQFEQPPVQQEPPQPQFTQPQFEQPPVQQAPPQPQAQQFNNMPPAQQFNPQQGQQFQPAFGGGGAPVTTQAPPKKKNGAIRIIIAVLIIAIVGGVYFAGAKKPEKKFYGTWTAAEDMTDEIRNKMGDIGKYLGDDFSFVVDFKFEFKDNNTYVLTVEKDTFEKTKTIYLNALKKAMIGYGRAQYPQLKDYSDEEMEKFYEKSLGKTLDKYVEEEMGDFTYESFSESINLNGNFKVEDDKLFLSDALNHSVDPKTYAVFEVKSEDEIVVKEYYIDEKPDDTTFALPMTLVRNK